MIKNLIAKIFFWAVDTHVKYTDINQKRIDEWLARQYGDMGFREYFRKRDLELLKSISNKVDHETYVRLTGQRDELLLLLQKVDVAYQVDVKNKKIKEAQQREQYGLQKKEKKVKK